MLKSKLKLLNTNDIIKIYSSLKHSNINKRFKESEI